MSVWKVAGTLPFTTAYTDVTSCFSFIKNGCLFAIYPNTTQVVRAPILANGTLGTWAFINNNLPRTLDNIVGSFILIDDRIYCVGGTDITDTTTYNDTLMCRIDGNILTPWVSTKAPFQGSSFSVWGKGKTLYATGFDVNGNWTNQLWSTTVGANGMLNDWKDIYSFGDPTVVQLQTSGTSQLIDDNGLSYLCQPSTFTVSGSVFANTNAIYQFHPDTKVLSKLSSFFLGDINACSVIKRGSKMYALGGLDSAFNFLTSFFEITMENGRLQNVKPKEAYPVGIANSSLVINGNYLYAVAGQVSGGTPNPIIYYTTLD